MKSAAAPRQAPVQRGNVVWSVIEESREDGQPAQPAIRANVTIPNSKVELKMTIRKNTDQSIPASHLIEMVFTVPEGFPVAPSTMFSASPSRIRNRRQAIR